MDRRDFLKVAGIGGASVAGSVFLVAGHGVLNRSESLSDAGPPDRREWVLEYQDMFQHDELDEERWGLGWGWGWNTNTSSTQVRPENVSVRDGKLSLQGTHDGQEIHSGVVNTKNIVSIRPGTYVEARIKFARRTGFLNAFWAKPVSELWPPEIDIVELFQQGDNPTGTTTTHHHLHYSSSGIPGDSSTHRSIDRTSTPGGDLTEEFHTYGLEWHEDRVVPYVDGQAVHEWTDETILSALRAGSPFYLMLSLNIGNFGTPDTSEQWGEEMLVDWVRVWRRDESAQ